MTNIVATWDGIPIDCDLLAGYGYIDNLTVDGVTYPRYLGYIAAGISQFSVVTATVAANAATASAAAATASAAVTTTASYAAMVSAATIGTSVATAAASATTATTQAGIATSQATTATAQAGIAATQATAAAASAAVATLIAVPSATLSVRGAVRPDGTSILIAGDVISTSLTYKTYVNRSDLRSTESPNYAVVEGLGLFVWLAGSTEPDDDETCFVSTHGAWTLAAADPDYVFASWLADFDDAQGRTSDLEGRSTALEGRATSLEGRASTLEARATSDEGQITSLQAFQAKFLRGSFAMTLTTLAATISANFTVTITGAAVGDSVIVTPGDAFGTAASDQGRLSYSSYVSASNTVTVSVRNASAASATLTASTWSVLVVKQ